MASTPVLPNASPVDALSAEAAENPEGARAPLRFGGPITPWTKKIAKLFSLCAIIGYWLRSFRYQRYLPELKCWVQIPRPFRGWHSIGHLGLEAPRVNPNAMRTGKRPLSRQDHSFLTRGCSPMSRRISSRAGGATTTPSDPMDH